MPIDTTEPVLEPHTEQFVDGLANAPPIYTLSPHAARSVLVRAQSIPVGKPSAQIEDIAFPVGPTGSVPVRIVRPPRAVGALPVIMYFHGGGWVMGDRGTHDRLLREIAVGVEAAVVFVDYARFANGPWLTKRAMEWFWDAYLPDLTTRKRPTATPLNASLDQLAGLPEALVVVDENDVLRDEGEAYARKLSNAGVRVTSTRYNGTIHDFVMLNALADTPAARGAITQPVCALKTSLG